MKNIRTASALVAAALLAIAAPLAHAQATQAEGRYESKTTDLHVLTLDSEKGVVAASSSIGTEGCAGGVAGLGKVTGHTLVFTPYTKFDATDSCKITVQFDAKFRGAKITEDGCMTYHGAACAWEGQTLVKKK